MGKPNKKSIARRVERAKAVLDPYRAATGAENEETETVICDLIADLLHLLHKEKPEDIENEVQEVFRRAEMHFTSECNGEDDF